MKKVLFLFVLSAIMVSCKNSEEKNTEELDTAEQEAAAEFKSYRGEFIYLDDAAVFKGNTYIYGVTMDEMAAKLAEQVAPVKNNEFDMVHVVVKGVVNPKPEGDDGWDEILTIKEIVNVSNVPSPADIKFEETEETKD